MYRCKLGIVNKVLHGVKVVFCVGILLYLLSYTTILQQTYSVVTHQDIALSKRPNNETTRLKTTVHNSESTTASKDTTTTSYNNNDHVSNKEDNLNEDDRVSNKEDNLNEDDRTLNKEDNLNEDDCILNKEDKLNEDDRILNKEDNLNEDDRILNKEDNLNEDDRISNKSDGTLSKATDINDDNTRGDDRTVKEGDTKRNEEDLMVDEEDENNEDGQSSSNEEQNTTNEEGRNENSEKSTVNGDLIINEEYRNESNEKMMINEKYFGVNRKVKVIGCKGLFKRDISGAHRARKIVTEELPFWSIKAYKEKAANCSSFIDERGYITHHLTTEEKLFPIAYSILMYKNVEQVERLLRAIYRPQNIYCIHVDKTTNDEVYKALSIIADCFENVFVLSKRINVVWGKMSVLTPEILCMQELWKRHKTWKYFINLTGQEFPLKTNYELVKILQAYRGANDVEATLKLFRERCRGRSRVRPPHGIRVTKGAVHIAVTRGYVNYILHDQRAKDILKWMSYACDIPDEAFFTTLNHNPHLRVPGSYKGHPETTPLSNRQKPYLARFKNRLKSPIHRWPCHGKWVRAMCIFNFEDLYQLSTRKELFANKFHLYDNPLPYACMEELIFNRTRDEFQGTRTFDASWYSTLGFVKKHIPT